MLQPFADQPRNNDMVEPGAERNHDPDGAAAGQSCACAGT